VRIGRAEGGKKENTGRVSERRRRSDSGVVRLCRAMMVREESQRPRMPGESGKACSSFRL